MSEITDIAAAIKKLIESEEGLNKVGKAAKRIKTDMAPSVQTIREMAKELENADGKAEDLSESFNKAKSSGVNLAKYIGAVEDGVQNQSKAFRKVTTDLNNYNDSQIKLYKLTKYLNTTSGDQIDAIKKLDAEIVSSIKTVNAQEIALSKLGNTTKNISEGFKQYKKELSGMKKTGVNSFIENTTSQLASLKGVMKKADFNVLEKKIEKLDNTSFANLPAAIKEISDSLKDVRSKAGPELVKKLDESFNTQGPKKIIDSLQELKKDTSFGELSEKRKRFISGLIKDFESGRLSTDELQKKLERFSKIKEGLEKERKPLFDVSVKDLGNKLSEGEKQHKALNDLLEKPRVLQVNLESQLSQTSDTINSVLGKKNQGEDISPAEQKTLDILMEQERSLKNQIRDLSELEEQAKNNNMSESDVLAKKEELDKKSKDLIKKAKLNNAIAERHLSIVEKVNKQGMGSEKVQEFSDKIMTAHAHIDKFKKSLGGVNPIADKILGGMGGAVKGVADGIMSNKAALGVLAATVGVLKKLIDLDKIVKEKFKEVADSGVLIGVAAKDMDKAMNDAYKSANNFGNLAKSALWKDTIILNKKEILGVSNAFLQAGVSAKSLEEQTKNTKAGIKGDTNALLEAAETAHVFGTKLGKSDAEMATMLGNLTYEYGTQLATIQDGFYAVTDAAKGSTMGAIKFMGVVQAATAGMAMYDDQIVDTANALKNMEALKVGLSGKDLATASKSSAEFATNRKGLQVGLATMGKDKRLAIAAQVDKDIEKRKEEMKKMTENERKRAQIQIDNMSDLSNSLKNNDLLNAAQYMSSASTGVKQKVLAESLKGYQEKAKINGKFNASAFEGIASSGGIDKELIESVKNTRGAIIEAIEAGTEASGEKSTYEEGKKDTANLDNKVKSATNELISGGIEETNRLLGGAVDWLIKIAGIVALIQGGGKFIKGASGYLKNLKKVPVPPGGTGGLSSAAEEGVEAVAKTATKGLETTVKGASNVGKLTKLSKFGGAATGGLLAAGVTGFSSYSDYQEAKESGASEKELKSIRNKGIGKTVGAGVGTGLGVWGGAAGGAAAGAAIGSIVPILGTAIGAAAGGIIGGFAGGFGVGWLGEEAGDLIGGAIPIEDEKDKLMNVQPTNIATPQMNLQDKGAALMSTPVSAGIVGAKNATETEKVVKEIISKSPYAITQNFYGVTDKNFKIRVAEVMRELEKERSQV